MVKLTKLFCVLVLCLLGVASASAGEKVYATFADPQDTAATWDSETSSFSWSQSWYNQIKNIGLPTGDISDYKKLVVDYEIQEGDQFRILFYQGGSNIAVYVTKANDGASGIKVINIYETLSADPIYSADFILNCTEIMLSGAGGSGKVKINSMYLETYDEGDEKPNVKPEEDEVDPGNPAGDFVDFTTAFPSLEPRIGIGADGHPIKLGNGDVVVGARSQNVIADLSPFTKLTMVTSPNLKLVLYMNHEVAAQQNAGDYAEADAGKYVFMNVQADENGLIEVDLTQFEKQNLNCICLPWDNSNKGTVWYILLTESEATKTIYLNPAIWDDPDATERYAAYMFNNYSNGWTNFTAVEGTDGIFTATIPVKYTGGIILCRMNGGTTENNWDNKWNQTDDIKSVNNNALYTITGWGQGEDAKSTYDESVYGETPEPLVISSMTIVGDFIGGEATEAEPKPWWNPANGWAMTQSTENPAIWTLTKEFEAAAQTYEYKAVANNNFTDYVLPAGDNAKFTFGTDEYPAGKYELTFTADTNKHELTLVAVKKEEPQPEVTYTVAGTAALFGSDWDVADANNDMTQNADGIYRITYTDKALTGNVEYKVVKNHAWGEGNEWPAKNRVIGISMPGTYDITINFDPATGDVWETMAVAKTITDAGYATFCAPYDLNFVDTGVRAFFAKKEGDKVKFYEIFNAPANTGLLLKAAAGTYKLKMETVKGEAAANVDGNVLTGVLEDTPVAAGSFVLMKSTSGVGFYKTKNEFTVGAYTAYIKAEVAGAARSFIGFDMDDTTTAIEGVATVNENNSEVYNLQGQRVVKAQKGLYIINGKKVLVK
jgi:hypothetical protein